MHIVVYAGPPKSASTTLQVALWHNRDVLRGAGIEYIGAAEPDGWIEWSLVSLYAAPAVLASSGLFPTRRSPARLERQRLVRLRGTARPVER